MKKENRFITTAIYHDALAACTKVIVDKKTRVQYLFHNEGTASGMCVLVDADGKPLLADTPIEEDEEVIRGAVKDDYQDYRTRNRGELEPIREVKPVVITKREKKAGLINAV